jgi:hypothetical protein
MTPSKIVVLIESDDTEKEAKLRHFSSEYGAGLYETEDGREFYVDPEHIKESLETHNPVKIPLQVITQRQEMLAKLAWAQEELNRLHKQNQSGLILPDGIN